MFEIVVGSCLFTVLCPVVVYLSVKFGTYAYFQGRRLYNENRKKGDR